MDHRENYDAVSANSKVDAVGKSMYQCFPNSTFNFRIAIRLFGNQLENAADFKHEFRSETRLFAIVPIGRFVIFPGCNTTKGDWTFYACFTRARISRSTCSQGIVSSGKASSSATRRASSCRRDSLIGLVAVSWEMLSQIACTNSSRSSIDSRSIPSDSIVTGIFCSK